MTTSQEELERALKRLVAAGVAEQSTLVIEFDGMPIVESNGGVVNRPAAAMSSRVDLSSINGAIRHRSGLVDGYVTYLIPIEAWRGGDGAELMPSAERLAFGLREGVERIRAQGVHVRRFVATGFTSPCGSIEHELVQTIADVLGERVSVRPCRDVEESGGRILQVMRGEHRFMSASHAVRILAGHDDATTIRRDLHRARGFEVRWRDMRSADAP